MKTLQDLKYGSHCPSCCIITVDPTELKNTAIEWVKNLREDWDNYEGGDASNDNVQFWIKHFFGLTEEDLE